MGFLLYMDGKPDSEMFDSLEQAKLFGERYTINEVQLRIESFEGTAVSRIWIYDYELKEWCGQMN